MVLWLLAIVSCIVLSLELLWRGHFSRFRILFVYSLCSPFTAIVLHHIYVTFSTDSAIYLQAWLFNKIVEGLLQAGVCVEATLWRRKEVWMPQGIYLLIQGFALGSQHLHFDGIDYLLENCLRYVFVGLALWFIFVFRHQPKYRKDSYNG